MSIYDQLKKNYYLNFITEMVPYVRKLNLHPINIKKGEVVLELEITKDVSNHVGCAHAGALYSFMETLAGGVLVTSIGVENISILVVEGAAKYFYPGMGKLTGSVVLSETEISVILNTLKSSGKCRPEIRTQVYNEEGKLVSEGVFTYSLYRMDDKND